MERMSGRPKAGIPANVLPTGDKAQQAYMYGTALEDAGIPANVLPTGDKAQRAYDTALQDAVTLAYVLARGDKAAEAYCRALVNGKTYDKRVKVFFIGQDGVGKTSVVRSLYDEPFNHKEESTEGVQMHKPLKNVDENAWKNGDVLQHTTAYDHKYAEIMSKVLSVTTAKQQMDEELSRGQTEKEEKDKEEEHEKLPEEQNRTDREKEGIPEVIASLTGEKQKGDESHNDEGICPVMWDFAGQAVYHAIHPIFLSREAVYVLVFDITKNLSDTAQCHVMVDGRKEMVQSPDSEDTNLDHVMRWMDMVHSLEHSIDQKRAPKSLPPVILVGTHADGVDGDPWKEMYTLLDTFCDNNEVYGKHIIADRFIVDNTHSGSGEEDPQIVELRQKILNVAGMMPHTKNEIPLQWLHVEKEIDSAKQKMKYVKKRKFAEIFYNSEKDDDLAELLYFLHARGTIIYHDCDSSPDCLVVLDPHWLIDVLCQIITPAAPRKNDPLAIRKQRRILETKGILAEELLHDACKNLKLDDIQEYLLSIMVRFNLICNWRNQEGRTDYLVPCMLTAQPPSNEAESTSVYLTFSTNYVPSGLFSRLVVLIGRWASSRSSCSQPQLFAKTACFFVGEYHCLCLACYKSVIKLHVQVSRHGMALEREPGLCLEILSCLTESLENLRTDCHWLQSMSWELCAQCDLCPGKVNPMTKNCFWHKKQGCSHEDCAHYIPLNSSPFCCPDAPGPDRHLCKEKFKPWTKSFDPKDPDTVQPQKSLQLDQAPHSVELCNRRPLLTLEGLPPQLSFTLPRLSDLEPLSKPWNEVKLPIDALLLTVNDCEFVSCYAYLKDPLFSYYYGLGYVYFGTMGEGQVKVALLKCGSASPGGILIDVKNAAEVLRPKVVGSVGTCGSLMHEKAKLGDVVLAAKLTTYARKEFRNDQVVPCGVKTPCSKDTAHLIKHAAFGWKAPLKNPKAREIAVHSDSEVLSGPELVNSGWRKEELIKQHPTATAIEMEGEGVFSAAYDLKMEWLVVKGISNYADGRTTETARWKTFASTMAASIVCHMLKNPIVLRDWPHYKGLAAAALAGPSRVLAAGAGNPGM